MTALRTLPGLVAVQVPHASGGAEEISMTHSLSRWSVVALTALFGVSTSSMAQTANSGALISERVKKLTRAVQWKQVAAIPVNFNTFHPQGMVKIGDTLYVSSVDIKTPTKRYAQLTDGYDRDTGEGVGHLFKLDLKGNLISDLTLGDGSIYHPGGIDYDGKWIWVPCRRISPEQPRDHLPRRSGRDEGDRSLSLRRPHRRPRPQHRQQLTARRELGLARFYTWTLDANGVPTNAKTPPEQLRVANRSGYIDYQDCKYLGRGEALCSGLNNYQMKKDGPRFPLGGFEIVDLKANQAIFQIPVELWTESGLPMTQNPFWVEPTSTGLRAYFMPEDEKSTLYIYEADVT
jgi:hypothetical protein